MALRKSLLRVAGRRACFYMVLVLFLLLAACQRAGETARLAASPVVASPTTESSTASPLAVTAALPTTTATPASTATPVNTATPTSTATSTPSPTLPPSPTATAVTSDDLSLTLDDVTLYPVPEIFAGDRVTFQVRPNVPQNIIVSDVLVDIFVNGTAVSSDLLARRNWAGRAEGVYQWVWDTTNQSGTHEIQVVVDPQDTIQVGDEDPTNNVATFTVDVRRPADLPLSQVDLAWVTTETNCCNVHVLTHTAAYRDLPHLLQQVETAVATASERLQTIPEQRLEVYLIDRNIGQGGFAGSDMVVSYLDRPYAGGRLNELLVHEAVHIIDRQFAPQRVPFLAEGVAVWASGGHYKPENIHERAAALLEIEAYLPLRTLINDFYPVQHEIGYLEAAGFVSYLIDTYGWPRFREFYTNTTADDAPTEAEAIDVNLQALYGRSLDEMEQEWLAFLQQQNPGETAVLDLRTTLRYYDVMRRYQLHYDPTAHFLSAWLPHPNEVKEQGNPADLLRHPQSEINIALEALLLSAEEAMRTAQDYERANVILDSVTRVLDNDGAFIDPLAKSYLDIVRLSTALGYEVQRVTLTGNRADVVATTAFGTILIDLDLQLNRQGWMLVN